MSTRRETVNLRCPNCYIHHLRCLCSLIKPQQIKHHISLIVHVREINLTSNTARFAQIWIRGRRQEHFDAQKVFDSFDGIPLYLFPDPDAQSLTPEFIQSLNKPIHFIVPDGSWSQARKFKQRETLFKEIPSVTLPKEFQREYLLRKSLHPNWLSTYEAIAHTLGVLGEEKVEEEMMIFFRSFVRQVLSSRYTSQTE
jgi:DTW domain-containing protein YfiP